MDGFLAGKPQRMQEAQDGPLTALPALPSAIDAASTADYIRAVLDGRLPVPEPIALQVAHIVRLAGRI